MQCNDASIPEAFWIFVNLSAPITAHNMSVAKTLFSGACPAWDNPEFVQEYLRGTADYLPFAPAKQSPGFISVFSHNLVNDYVVEYDAELTRKQDFPLMPSRLSAVYAFGDPETCQQVHSKYGWAEPVLRFRLKEHALNRVARVNMEIVSLARKAYRVGMLEPQDKHALWRSYWDGTGNVKMELPDARWLDNRVLWERKTYESGVLWEYLIEGQLVLAD